MEDFDICFPKLNYRSNREFNITRLEKTIRASVRHNSWNYNEEYLTSWCNLAQSDRFVVYNLSGAICHSILKKNITCDKCRQAFCNSSENLVEGVLEASHVSGIDRGALIHPNVNLFKICLYLDRCLATQTEDGIHHVTLYDQIIRELPQWEDTFYGEPLLTFPCEQHMSVMVATIIHDYLLMRIRHVKAIIMKNKETKSRETRKNAKLVSS